jgi:prepilin signal peptidase PulO-like enzyme (type II secretory pathway)
MLFIFSALVVIFVFDLRHYIIPDEVVYPAILVALLWRTIGLAKAEVPIDVFAVGHLLFPAFLAGGFFLFLVLLTKGKGMGGGDVKLGFLMGLVAGYPNVLLALFLAFVLGALAGLALILTGKAKMKSMLPFGPFLVLGLLVSYFYGTPILGWYWSLVLS